MDAYILTGFFFLLVAVLLTIRNFWIFNYKFFFWFCDFAAFLLAISFFIGNFQIVKALINIGLLGQISDWIFNMPPQISILIKRGKSSFKDKYRLFTEGLAHITLPVALIATYNIAPSFGSLIYSFAILCIMFIFGLLFTSRKENINALFHVELGLNEDLGMISDGKKESKTFRMPFHTFLWVFYAFLMCLPNFLIQYLIYHFVVL